MNFVREVRPTALDTSQLHQRWYLNLVVPVEKYSKNWDMLQKEETISRVVLLNFGVTIINRHSLSLEHLCKY